MAVYVAWSLYRHSRREEADAWWEIMPVLLAVAVAILAVSAWHIIDKERQARNDGYFHDLVEDTQDLLVDRYNKYEEALRGGLGLFYASDHVKREEWRLYVSALDVEQTLPGINGIGYIDYVPASDLPDYLERTRADNAPDFKNHPDTSHDDKFIIKYIEPVANNVEAVGLDIGFEDNRREAAEAARDTGKPQLTRKIMLVQDHKQQAGFLLLLPHYEGRAIPATIEERREKLLGWVYAPFIGPNFFKGVNDINSDQLYLRVYDGHQRDPEQLIYSSAGYDGHHDQHLQGDHEHYNSITKLEIAGRVWTLEWHISDLYAPPGSPALGLAILIFGLAFAALLYFTLRRLLHSKKLIRAKVRERTCELQEAEAAVREALGFQDLVTNSIPDFVFVKDSEFRIVQGNEAFLSLYPEEQQKRIIGYTTVESYDEKEAEAFLAEDKKALREGYSEVEERLTFPDGRERTLMTKKVRFENAKGDKFILGIGRDITEVKEAAGKVVEANRELQRSNQELERFAYIASHDLQEPLRKIAGFTERLEKHFAEQLAEDEKARTYMEFVTGGVDRMRDLIMGLLQYSRVTTAEANIVKLDTNKIVEDALENLSESIKDSAAKVSYENLPEVYYDKVMLTQLFQNLISNAIKYRSEQPPDIHITAEEQGDYWAFSVSDNGIGMEEQYLERIFEMFQRLHRKEDIPGTGIGLSLCQKIVERYGGAIRVKSTPGKGSTFTFTVPTKNDGHQHE